MTWKDVHVGVEGDVVQIGGFKVWDMEWRRVQEEPIELPHPAHASEMHPFWVYDIGPADKPVRFAATELSPSVWGFYVPKAAS